MEKFWQQMSKLKKLKARNRLKVIKETNLKRLKSLEIETVKNRIGTQVVQIVNKMTNHFK